MKLTAPTTPIWGVATALGVLGILGKFVTIPFITANCFWFLVAGFGILAIACLLKGL